MSALEKIELYSAEKPVEPWDYDKLTARLHRRLERRKARKQKEIKLNSTINKTLAALGIL